MLAHLRRRLERPLTRVARAWAAFTIPTTGTVFGLLMLTLADGVLRWVGLGLLILAAGTGLFGLCIVAAGRADEYDDEDRA